jgi:thiaminase (transcriptional activator TenA)
VAYLRGQLDAVWAGLDDGARADVTDLFTRAVAAERAFFDAAWAGFEVGR